MADGDPIPVVARKCCLCERVGEVVWVDPVEYRAWVRWGRGPAIHDLMPTTPPEIRERLLTGTHAHCVASAFPGKVAG